MRLAAALGAGVHLRGGRRLNALRRPAIVTNSAHSLTASGARRGFRLGDYFRRRLSFSGEGRIIAGFFVGAAIKTLQN